MSRGTYATRGHSSECQECLWTQHKEIREGQEKDHDARGSQILSLIIWPLPLDALPYPYQIRTPLPLTFRSCVWPQGFLQWLKLLCSCPCWGRNGTGGVVPLPSTILKCHWVKPPPALSFFISPSQQCEGLLINTLACPYTSPFCWQWASTLTHTHSTKKLKKFSLIGDALNL